MQGISLLLTITKREFEQEFTSFLQHRGISAVFSALCRGTAGQNILNLLGIEKTEKVLLFAMMESKKAARLMREMVSDMGINMPGNGIALRMPVGSIGGASCMKYLMEKQDIIIGEVTDMEEKQSFPYELIVAIAERGSMDMVMEAARSANAGGGTILHAKGTGTDFTSKFFGVSIAAEKEMLLIVANRKDKAGIMRAIMEKAGIRSQAHTALFSLPVEDVVGLTSVMNAAAE
ncbi:MAG: P-II family nitrogen regulator [Eubacteriales bacterium]|nr:P-II family nitrogen regulator [Eubacteriales bacterium]